MCKFQILEDQDKYHMMRILLISIQILAIRELILILGSFMVLFQFVLSSKVAIIQAKLRKIINQEIDIKENNNIKMLW